MTKWTVVFFLVASVCNAVELYDGGTHDSAPSAVSQVTGETAAVAWQQASLPELLNGNEVSTTSQLSINSPRTATLVVSGFNFNFPSVVLNSPPALQWSVVAVVRMTCRKFETENSVLMWSYAVFGRGAKLSPSIVTPGDGPTVPDVPFEISTSGGIGTWSIQDLNSPDFQFRLQFEMQGVSQTRPYLSSVVVELQLKTYMEVYPNIIPSFGYSPDGRSAFTPGPQLVTISGENMWAATGTLRCKFGNVESLPANGSLSVISCLTPSQSSPATYPVTVLAGEVQSDIVNQWQYRTPCPGEPFCSGKGNCIAGGVCSCLPFQFGADCATFCNNATCSNQGSCIPSSGVCDCDAGWQGPDCTQVECNELCVNGQCFEPNVCACHPNYFGTNCATFCNEASTCNGHGECTPNGSCACKPGWELPGCNTPICDSPCSGNLTCVGPDICGCQSNYYGEDCGVYCNTALTCNSHGTCDINGMCACTDGWDGLNCQLEAPVGDNDMSPTSSSAEIGFIIIGLAGFILIIGIILVAVFLWRRSRRTGGDLTPSITLENVHHKVDILKNVKLGQVIGKGEFGEVYLGDYNGTPCACKQLRTSDVEEVIREASLIFKLSHPNIVRLLGVYISDANDTYLVLDYVNGGSLGSFLPKEQANLTVDQLMHIAIGIAQGMAYLEEKGITHRDLAARNILISQGNLQAIISDFGLSRENVYQRSSSSKIPVRWSAPEVLQQGPSTIKSDVFSFGVVLWEIFSFGMMPFGGKTNEEAAGIICDVQVTRKLNQPKMCPDALYQLMMRCWSYQATDRPSFQQVLTELQSPTKHATTYSPMVEHSTDDMYNT